MSLIKISLRLIFMTDWFGVIKQNQIDSRKMEWPDLAASIP